MTHTQDRISDNVQRVRDQIHVAAEASGRQADDIRLVAVSKYVDVDVIRALVGAGCDILGENRPQQLWRRAAELEHLQMETGFQWHMIGHLQRNKVARTLPLVTLVHSIDSSRLLAAVNNTSAASNAVTRCLLEINISGDEAKHGFAPHDLVALLPTLSDFPHVRVEGLMGMASLESHDERARGDFAALRELRDQRQADCPPGIDLRELSMGMSRDFVVAIEEGATIVRVGSALFAGL